MDLVLGNYGFGPGSLWASPFATRNWMADFDKEFSNWPDRTRMPSYNSAVDDNGTIHLEVELPGIPREDVTVEVSGDRVLTIAGKRSTVKTWGKAEEPAEEAKPNGNPDEKQGEPAGKSESYYELKRSFTLPTTADSEKLDCKLENGVLRMSIPKKEEKDTTMKIAIQ
eukprot:CAMPEP_0198332838 /NCGR_PEP_ID=MMETSP1450-20131203/18545_1 /TAXON_ID=753684 ORGANISM="Madagascaria erythrocladiodes, Strain CCMP3234" /NCGR_SAMPLE_ID=MMETSP1450 /ASSEMBLY_ACC=CAM_ASM_001115 /LENGTH=167 /DNA_ID=CAMNT_0044037307 /DNA_START=81 /DNA_END=584 /DNA_ORIENTATION=+